MKSSSPKKTEHQKTSQVSPKERLLCVFRDWKWGIFILILFLAALTLTLFWENRIEPKLGMHVTGETTDRSDALPPVIEKTSQSAVVIKSVPSSSTVQPPLPPEASPQQIPAEQRSATDTINALTFQLQELAHTQHHSISTLEQRQRVLAAFLLLRQDIREGLPFEASLALFADIAQAILEATPEGDAILKTLTPLASKPTWPRWRLLHHAPTFAFQPPAVDAETSASWLEKVKHFFQNLFVLKRTQKTKISPDQPLQQVTLALKSGDLEKALKLLQPLRLQQTPDVKQWLEQAHQRQQLEAALLLLQQLLIVKNGR